MMVNMVLHVSSGATDDGKHGTTGTALELLMMVYMVLQVQL